MKTAQRHKTWTYQGYLKLDDDEYYEIINNNLLKEPAPAYHHQEITGNLFAILHRFLKKKRQGKVAIAPVDVVLDDNNVVQPDILFIQEARTNIIKEKGVFGVPDLVVEVISPDSLKRDLEDKKQLYERFGVQEYWIVFPKEQAIEVFELKNKKYEVVDFEAEEGTIQSSIMPGFQADLNTIFEK